MLFRPVRENDLDDIVRLAARAGVGMTSLPHDAGRLAARIQRSIETFAGELPRGQQGFLAVGAEGAAAGFDLDQKAHVLVILGGTVQFPNPQFCLQTKLLWAPCLPASGARVC